MDKQAKTEFTQAVITIVASVPYGKVATYGQVARLAGFPSHARMVGRILNTCSDQHELPWQRIVNAKGEVSMRSPWSDNAGSEVTQRMLLEEEGVEFNEHGRIYMSQFAWSE